MRCVANLVTIIGAPWVKVVWSLRISEVRGWAKSEKGRYLFLKRILNWFLGNEGGLLGVFFFSSGIFLVGVARVVLRGRGLEVELTKLGSLNHVELIWYKSEVLSFPDFTTPHSSYK